MNPDNLISPNNGEEMYGWVADLFPICRSISGNGVRETLTYIKAIFPDLKICSIKSGEQVFDWTVPKEWNIKDAYIEDENNNKIVDFKENNLHVLGYSTPIDQIVDLQELDKHLYSLPDQPDLIPYITSYYVERWGFCLPHKQRQELQEGKYRVFIDSTLESGELNYGELVIPGDTDEEILLSTYVCHPSMANNELSGPAVSMSIAKWLIKQKNRRYTYRILFLVETIGSIIYLSKHVEHFKKKLKAGFVLSCVGDDKNYSYMPSRLGSTLADQVALHVLDNYVDSYSKYSFLERGSDERQYCSPKVDLPVASIMRSKYGEFPEYHTSADNLDFISPSGLYGALKLYIAAIKILEENFILSTTVSCEPQLGKRGLYPSVSTKETASLTRDMMNVIAYSDGKTDVLSIADRIGLPALKVIEIIEPLVKNGLINKT